MKSRKGFAIGELVLVFAIALVIGVLMMPFIRYNRRNMDKTMCANNIRKIGLALYIYAREHGGKFPPELKTLYTQQYLADKSLMNCPARKIVGTLDEPDYLYTTGLSVREASGALLVQDTRGNHPRGGRNVLCVSGVVGWKE